MCLPKCICPPEFLVGKRVEHEFLIKEAGKKQRNWLVYTGTVTRIIKRGAVPMYTQYEIIYDINCRENKDEGESSGEFQDSHGLPANSILQDNPNMVDYKNCPVLMGLSFF